MSLVQYEGLIQSTVVHHLYFSEQYSKTGWWRYLLMRPTHYHRHSGDQSLSQMSVQDCRTVLGCTWCQGCLILISLDNTSIIDWLSNGIHLFVIAAASWIEHTMSCCKKANNHNCHLYFLYYSLNCPLCLLVFVLTHPHCPPRKCCIAIHPLHLPIQYSFILLHKK